MEGNTDTIPISGNNTGRSESIARHFLEKGDREKVRKG
jgi:hypothetical protein